jgi:hypothetical protein
MNRSWRRKRAHGVQILLVVSAVATACGADTDRTVTFNRDVLPILQKNCQGCHRPGQIAPMSFLTYESSRPWAKAMKVAVATKKMPPWLADPEYGHFTNDRSLKQSEIDLISKWADSGAAEGKAEDAAPPLHWSRAGWTKEPDKVITLPRYTVPPKGTIEWLDMYIPNPYKDDVWLTSIEAIPSEPSVVHHMCIFFAPHNEKIKPYEWTWPDIKRDEHGNAIPDLNAAIKFTTSEVGVGTQGLEYCYEPGYTIDDYYGKHGAAKLLRAGQDLHVSMHYTTQGKEIVDETKIALSILRETPARRLLSLAPSSPSDPKLFTIPPNDPNWKSPPVDLTFNVDCEIVWMSPHMHYRGKDMTYTLTFPDGRSETILKVSHYDYRWQVGYDTSIQVPKGTKLHVDAHYDNSLNNRYNPDPNRNVYYGTQTWEEMMAPFINIVVAPDVELKGVVSGSRFANGA